MTTIPPTADKKVAQVNGTWDYTDTSITDDRVRAIEDHPYGQRALKAFRDGFWTEYALIAAVLNIDSKLRAATPLSSSATSKGEHFSDNLKSHLWKMYQEGQASADHTARQVFYEMLDSLAESIPAERDGTPVSATEAKQVDEEHQLLHDVLNRARETLLVSIKGTPLDLQNSLGKLNMACKAHFDWRGKKIAKGAK